MEPTPTLYEQILAAAGTASSAAETASRTAQQLLADAAAGVFDGKDGDPGVPGKDGEPGTPGRDGHTPVRGTDYFTEEDKAEMVASVLAALPGGDEVMY